jgi:hypothetical protein
MTTTPRIYVAILWGVSALFALYQGIVHGWITAWWLVLMIIQPLIVFVWWMVDRAALERRISRLEARSEIGYERRVTASEDLSKIEHKLYEIESRVARSEDHENGAARSGAQAQKQESGAGNSSVAGISSYNPK